MYLTTDLVKCSSGKWLLIHQKLTTRLKSKTWTNPEIKRPKKSHELKLDQTTDLTKIQITNKFLTPSLEYTE
jgi:hypothetical protein